LARTSHAFPQNGRIHAPPQNKDRKWPVSGGADGTDLDAVAPPSAKPQELAEPLLKKPVIGSICNLLKSAFDRDGKLLDGSAALDSDANAQAVPSGALRAPLT